MSSLVRWARGHCYEDVDPGKGFNSRQACAEWCYAAGFHGVSNPQHPQCCHPTTLAVGWAQIEETILGPRAALMRRFPDGPASPEDCVRASLRYVVDVVKAAVYVLVRDGRVRLFVPFTAGAEFRNAWSTFLDHPPRGGAHVPPEEMWANAGILCTLPSPQLWSSAFVCGFRHMLSTALAHAGAPRDAEFLWNKQRDHPLVRLDRRHPWAHVFPRGAAPPVEAGPLLPVASPYVDPAVFADVAVPLVEEWRWATGLLFPGDGPKKPARFPPETPWEDKRAVLFFRGGPTGAFGPAGNTRVLAASAADCGGTVAGVQIDCGLTGSGARRFRARSAGRTVEVYRAHVKDALKKKFVPMAEQGANKYLLVVDGHSAPNRLSYLMHTGSVLFVVASLPGTAGKRLWFHRRLAPFVHYVPVAADLSDLRARLRWAAEHDAQCAAIGAACAALARELFSVEGLAASLRAALWAMQPATSGEA